MRIVAVCGSLIRDGNVSAMLDAALEEYAGDSTIEVARFDLSGTEIGPCRQCNWCLKNQTEDRYCSQEDDMARVYEELLDASALIIATPVHFGRLSGTTADFIDRLRVFVHGNLTRGRLRNRVGGSLAVSWFRNAGIELTLMSVNVAFDALGMVVATPDLGIYGGSAFSSLDGTGRREKGDRLLVRSDALGLATARSLAYRVAELARLLEEGRRQSEG